MKVAIVTETFLPKIDGIVTMVTKTVESLQAGGDEVVIFAPSGGPAELYGAEVVGLPSLLTTGSASAPAAPDRVRGRPDRRVRA